MNTTKINNTTMPACTGICKGMSVLILIAGSVPDIPPAIRIVIFSFIFPLLLLTDGMSITDFSISSNLKFALNTYVKPYVIFAFTASAIKALLTADINTAGYVFLFSLNDYVRGMSSVSKILTEYESVGLVWFLTCLFLTRMLYVTLRKALMKFPAPVWITAVIIISVSGCLISHFIGFLPWSVDAAMTALIFTAAGDLFKTWGLNGKRAVIAGSVSFIIWGVLLSQYAQIDLTARHYPLGPLCFICALGGSIFMFFLSYGIRKIPFISSLLDLTGRKWIILFIALCLELRFFDWNAWIYLPLNFTPGWIVKDILHTSLILAVTVVLCLIHKTIQSVEDLISESDSKSEDSKRLDWPDVAKGICMISIILGHMGIDWINQIVFVYHIPVFYLISGYFLKKKSSKAFIPDKARRLLIPYYITGLILCIGAGINSAIAGTSVSDTLKDRIKAVLFAAGDNWPEPFAVSGIGAIWFLWALFFALIIVNLFVEKKLYHVIIAVIAFIGWASFYKTQVWLPLSIQAGMLAAVYVLIGYECRKRRFDPINIKGYYLILPALITAIGMQQFKGLWLVHNYYGNGIWDFIVTIAASLVVIAVSVGISRGHLILRNIFRFIGRHSLIILCFHTIEMNIIPIGDWNLKLANLLSFNGLFAVLLLIVLKIVFCVLGAAAVAGAKKLLTKVC